MKVKFLKTHTHASVDYGVGDELELDEDTALRVIDWGVAEEVKPFSVGGIAKPNTTLKLGDTEL